LLLFEFIWLVKAGDCDVNTNIANIKKTRR